MRNLWIILVVCFATVNPAWAAASNAEMDPSESIALAVAGISHLAESGVEEHSVTPAVLVKGAVPSTYVHDALEELAYQVQLTPEDSFPWVGNSPEAWDADSTNWGETNMKRAYSYIMMLDPELERNLQQPGMEKELKKMKAQLKKAHKAFQLFLGTGVQFGVVPLGAVQCGVQFAALAILDPHTGKIWVFSKEGSGC